MQPFPVCLCPPGPRRLSATDRGVTSNPGGVSMYTSPNHTVARVNVWGSKSVNDCHSAWHPSLALLFQSLCSIVKHDPWTPAMEEEEKESVLVSKIYRDCLYTYKWLYVWVCWLNARGEGSSQKWEEKTLSIFFFAFLLNPPYIFSTFFFPVGRVHQCRLGPFFFWPSTSATFTAILFPRSNQAGKEVAYI